MDPKDKNKKNNDVIANQSEDRSSEDRNSEADCDQSFDLTERVPAFVETVKRVLEFPSAKGEVITVELGARVVFVPTLKAHIRQE